MCNKHRKNDNAARIIRANRISVRRFKIFECRSRKLVDGVQEIKSTKMTRVTSSNENQLQDWNNLDVYKDIASVSKIDDIFYHIHPECITEREGIYFNVLRLHRCTNRLRINVGLCRSVTWPEGVYILNNNFTPPSKIC